MEEFSNSWDILLDKLGSWWTTLVQNLPNIAIAVLLLVGMMFASRFVKRGIRKVVSRFSTKPSMVKLISSAASGFFMFLALVLILNVLNLEQTVTSLLAGAGIAGLVMGLAFQDTLSNSFAGIMLSVNDLYNIGDHVDALGYEGTIEKIGLRFTQLRTFQGQIIILPNKEVINSPIENFSITGERRIDLECGISYGDDLDLVEEVAREAIKNNVEIKPDTEIAFHYGEFGGSSINFKIRFWMDTVSKPNFLKCRHDAIKALKRAFDANGISIPFPIRTLDFGVSGGKGLGKVLEGRFGPAQKPTESQDKESYRPAKEGVNGSKNATQNGQSIEKTSH